MGSNSLEFANVSADFRETFIQKFVRGHSVDDSAAEMSEFTSVQSRRTAF